MPALARILDANANRAREAMRVMEDVARFALDDAPLSAAVKTLRHDLRGVLDRLPSGWLEANRNTPEDVGTAIHVDAERERGGLPDIAVAAGKRLSESLRVMEEVLKAIDRDGADEMQALRYRGYELDARLQKRLGAGRARQWSLCLILTESLCKLPWQTVLAAALDGGADCVQVREKGMDGGDLARRVGEVIAIARPAGAAAIVNDRADVAVACGADGVHVGQTDLSVADVRRLAGRTLLVGVSTHDMAEAAKAVEAGADYCGVGAMFASSLKPDRAPSSPAYLRAFLKHFPATPHLAIGGITPENARQIIEAGARGVAVSSAICAAADPRAAAAQLRAAFQEPAARPAAPSR
jgi:thiamine-phosphate pyrophosphorylase